MIRAFWEVLKDLWLFTFGILRRSDNIVFSTLAIEDSISHKINTPQTPVNSLAGVFVPQIESDQVIGQTAYVLSDSLICLTGPEYKFDTRVGLFSYGDKVIVTRMEGIFAEANTSLLHGWVESKHLTDDINKIFPSFGSGHVYESINEQVVKLRRFLKDESHGQHLGLPLQSAEFVLFELKRTQVNITWPPKRPRDPGTWQSILKGVTGVSMSLEPHTKSILEYEGNGTPGFLGYVESVRPNMSITLHSVGRELEGEYRKEEFTREEWQEWRPVFISFS